MKTVRSVVDVAGHGPAPRCSGCGRFFRAKRAVCIERWVTSPTPEPMSGGLYCPDCEPIDAMGRRLSQGVLPLGDTDAA